MKWNNILWTTTAITMSTKGIKTIAFKHTRMQGPFDELKTRLIDEWAQFDQSIVDAAISQWRRRLSACVRVRGAH